jgi:hypothetical protein
MDIAIQRITDRVGELAIADTTEDIVVLSDHRKLTFLEAGDKEGMEEDTIMVQEGVGMAEAVIQLTMVRITPRGRYSSDGMAVVAAVVDEGFVQGRHSPTLYKCL